MINLNDELKRIEAEAACDLPDTLYATPRQRAQRLLDCDDPPRGGDHDLCEDVAKSQNITETLARRDGLYYDRSTKIVEYPDGTIMTCLLEDGIRGAGYVIGYHHPGEGFRWV